MTMTGGGRRRRKEAKEEKKTMSCWTTSMCSHAEEKPTETEDIKMQCGIFTRRLFIMTVTFNELNRSSRPVKQV